MTIPSPLLKTIMFIVRTMLGTTFIFSGFVKAVDPKGLGYKIADYLSAMDITTQEWLKLPLIFGVVLICIEFVLGIYLFLGLRRRFTAILTLLAMLIFTIVSLILVIWHPVDNCGCFGDFIVFSDTQTFVKNIVLLALSALLVAFPSKAPTLVPHNWHWLISLYSCLFIVLFTIISIYFLPMIDFRPYKVGANLREMVFSNNSGEQGDEDAFVDFYITDTLNQDFTSEVLMDTSIVFLAVSPSLEEADFSVTEDFNALNDWCQDRGYHFYCLTASTKSEIDKWCYYNDAQYPFLLADATMLKTMIRSNPGLILLHNGMIRNKWSVHNMPTITRGQIDETLFETNKRSTTKLMMMIIFWYLLPLLILILLSNTLHGVRRLLTPKKIIRANSSDGGDKQDVVANNPPK